MTQGDKKQRIVDIHTHVYLPSYLDELRSRSVVPRILPPLQEGDDERLLILPGEEEDKSTKNGRPVGKAYSDVREKLAFMDLHGIDISVVSLANPWLDFMGPSKRTSDFASKLNEELNDYGSTIEEAKGRLYAFGTLPLSDIDASIRELDHIADLPKLRGVIMGTLGCGKGLDDPALVPLFERVAQHDLMIFLHPHYGVSLPAGETEVGHSLALALGFPFETTHAVARLILSGIFDRLPNLKILLAHAGGTLPFLAGRLDSCVSHDPAVVNKLQHPPSYYLKKLYYDAVVYHAAGVKATADFADPANMMFGTDHPFFPPLKEGKTGPVERWASVDSNLAAIKDAGLGDTASAGILGENAIRILGLNQ